MHSNKSRCDVNTSQTLTSTCDWGEHERAPHTRDKHEKICMYVSLTQISLTPIATLYDNGFSGRVQNSSRAFSYSRGALALA